MDQRVWLVRVWCVAYLSRPAYLGLPYFFLGLFATGNLARSAFAFASTSLSAFTGGLNG